MSKESIQVGTTPTLEQQAEFRYIQELATRHQNLYALCQSLILMVSSPCQHPLTTKDRKHLSSYYTNLLERERLINPHDRVAAVQRILAS
jgi:hypothetical protein